MFTYYLSIS